MKEKDFQTLFTHWVRRSKHIIVDMFGENCAFELKIEKGKSIRFDRVAGHQVEALREAQGFGFYHKINDMPVSWGANTKMRFTNPKPFDCFFMSNAKGYVVVWFYKKGQRKNLREMMTINISDWLRLESEFADLKRKSIKEEELREHAEVIHFC